MSKGNVTNSKPKKAIALEELNKFVDSLSCKENTTIQIETINHLLLYFQDIFNFEDTAKRISELAVIKISDNS